MKKIFIFLLLFGKNNIYSYRFICNGILSDGQERSDECGSCEDDNAARWPDPQIKIVVDYENFPKSISREDWQKVVKKSFRAWNEIDGSKLRLKETTGKSYGEFGSNEDIHEIFWITKKEDWRRLVGSGEFGTLGATLPRYTCGGDLGSKREIFDADLVLNGLPHINWQIDCPKSEDCISVQTTLVHELGHFFGLDHPCLMCNESVMTAVAMDDIKTPTLDDMKAIRTLYPDGSTGGFGFICNDDSSCQDGFKCIENNHDKYCSNMCESNEDCESSSNCIKIDENHVCALNIKGQPSSLGGEGENCAYTPCIEPLVCAGPGEENFHCFSPCQTSFDCLEGKSCVGVKSFISVCMDLRKKGEKCDYLNLCEERLMCVFENEQEGFCRSHCLKDHQVGLAQCSLGEYCEVVDNIYDVCIPKVKHINLENRRDNLVPQSPLSGGKMINDYERHKKPFGCSGINEPGICLWLLLMAMASRLIFKKN